MIRWQKWSMHVLVTLVACTGVALFWMKYLMSTDDPFAIVNHPWQPWMLDLHVLAAPVLLFVFGLVFQSHISYKLSKSGLRANRRSGILSLATFALMSASGYALQVVTAESLSRLLLVAHLATGAVFAVSYGAHLLVTLRLLFCSREEDHRLVA